MSRFMLRSNAEGSKLTEPKEKEKSKILPNSLKTPTKKGDSKKSRNCSNLKDSSPPQQLTAIKKISNDVKSQERSSPVSIICSLPLSRLTGIIEKLSINSPSKVIHNCNKSNDSIFTKPSQTNAGINQHEDDNDGNDREQEENQAMVDDDTSTSKSQDQLLVKTLCLYCDKKFSTHKMQLKHIEKFHVPPQDRRCSVRNSQLLTSPRKRSQTRQPEKTSPSLLSSNFPGCIYCKRSKPLETAADATSDFNGLFLHLTEYHADKYFGCKLCVLRFQNVGKLLKHMQNVHNALPEAQLKLSKDYNELLDETNAEATSVSASTSERSARSKQRHSADLESSETVSVLDQTGVIGGEEAILSRLGLTQNRRRVPSNRKGVRLRREASVPEILLKSDSMSSTMSTSTSLSGSPSKTRSRTTAKSTNTFAGDTDAALFRVPARTDSLSTAFDENFYKEVTANVRKNLLYYLDGKLEQRDHTAEVDPPESPEKSLPLLLRSTLASNVTIEATTVVDNGRREDSEIHVATNLAATTAFPTLLTAEQYCGDVTTTKIRRPHTKNSWKWKWDSVKKYKLINEGGKMVKKAKHPMLGLRDLSKLDMWTQLSMRQKHEKQLSVQQSSEDFEEYSSGDKRRLNDQLNSILDMRVLPHIILEQSEQAIIKLENDEFNFPSTYERHDESDDFYAGNIIGRTFADEGFLSMLQLLPRREARPPEQRLVLSGEWARPRCYQCMCCGNKFEKLKSLEEHKMFRHSNILATHYELVGRELLAGNLLQHLFIPKRALSYYGALGSNALPSNTKNAIMYRRVHTSAEEESSDSVQSISNSYATQHTYSLKNATTDDCDTDTKTTLLGDMNTVSPSHSLQSSFSSSMTASSSTSQHLNKTAKDSTRKWKCSKCSRKCNSMMDLYRHMLDCSGDYVWSMAKKRKYRYYCGSKKRRPTHKHHSSEARKNKQEKSPKRQTLENCTTEESSCNSYKPKTPPRPRPSDAESIKKMLENLPPKRVCKKIFPTVNKAKKTRKNTFITKLYNTKVLRKTRARQISNPAKRGMSTRFSVRPQSKTRALTAAALKCRKNKKLESTKRKISPTSVNPTNSNPKSNSPTEKRGSPKKEQTTQEEKAQTPETSPKKCAEELDKRNPSPKPRSEIVPATEKEKMEKAEATQSAEPAAVETVEDSNATPHTLAVNKDETAAEATPTASLAETGSTQESPKVPPAAEIINSGSRKRSKRISDCIAMLTGKLEEKLKTESNVNSKNDESLEAESKTTAVEKEKEKKTPKRKAISRRIIKPDNLDEQLPETKTSNSTIPTTITTITNTITTKTAATKQQFQQQQQQTQLLAITTAAATATITTTAATVVEAATTTTTTTTTTITPTTVAAAKKTTATKATKAILSAIQTATTSIASTTATTTTTIAAPALTTSTTTTTITPKIVLAAITSPAKAPPIPLPLAPTPKPQAKLVLPTALAPPTLVSIPISLASTLHAVPMPLKVLQSHLPVYLPVQQNLNTATLPPPPPAALPLPLVSANATATIMPTVTLLPPPPPTLLQSHVSPVLTAVSSTPLCSMEPLNLTSTKGPKKQTTAELRAQRPGMPARRQTICGFEARNLIAYNEMEPLDLSKKSRDPLPPPPPPALSALQQPRLTQPAIKPIELIAPAPNAAVPLSLTVQSAAQRLQVEEAAKKPTNLTIPPTLPTLPTETIFNKQFYSNLDLLKIPQVRATGFMQPMPEPLNAVSANASSNLVLNVNLSTNAPNTATPTAASSVPAPKVTNKKPRNAAKANVEPGTTVAPPSKQKEGANAKKENAAKNKPIAKMDEEVINHIDDAINSVINAVKESLPENEQHEAPAVKVSNKSNCDVETISHAVAVKPLEEPIINKENNTPPATAPQFPLTPKKRTLRSKTVDCRAELARAANPLTRSELLCSPVLRPSNLPNDCEKPLEPLPVLTIPSVVSEQNEVTPLNVPPQPLPQSQQAKVPIEKVEPAKQPPLDKAQTVPVKDSSEAAIVAPKEKTTLSSTPIEDDPKKCSAETERSAIAPPFKTDAIEPSLQESNVNLIAEENMSNINNTSSGFHSSSTPDNAGDVKKKQRRRRKNELAAIVADQLLESFKIDKARRDSLKKLENLAYEKSEDLLLTGMLLMSSTKRNASSGISFTQSTATEKRAESTKRQKQAQEQASNVLQAPKGRGKSNDRNISPSAKSAFQAKKNAVPEPEEKTIVEIGPRKSKRRQSRRHATPLDNENLSKLKSSLESFSIGIEKQLSEIEARNTNVFTVAEGKARKNLESSPPKPTSSILRPSILSATLEQVDNQKATASTENSKAPTFSRDPRLNKNIHKAENPAIPVPSDKHFISICDLEDDNYLTEIAKNVNEKIMSAENEDFAFADDGFEIANEFQDDSNSKFSRPPTSMSVRSAPNFNDDRSNFGSICDENTNTEVMDMDLDDEMSVYTSFSQDLGRGRGRKRRRRRSILLKRRPKKRRASHDLTAEKFECELCKKTFYAATSLAKHNMTLAHVSKVSEREYLLSKAGKSAATTLAIVEPKSMPSLKPNATIASERVQTAQNTKKITEQQQEHVVHTAPAPKKHSSAEKESADMDTAHRLSLNPDERLFFECCNILKSADTTRIARSDNDNENPVALTYDAYRSQKSAVAPTVLPINEKNVNLLQKQLAEEKAHLKTATGYSHVGRAQDPFRNPTVIPNSFNKLTTTTSMINTNERHIQSPTYTQFSAVTNTTSRFKTKAAMKGYENGNADLVLPDETKSRAMCKLTELADIALGHDDKPNTPEIAPNLDQAIIGTAKRIVTPEYVTLSVVDSRKECNYGAMQDNKKNTETQGSTSSKTIMHSSIIKAAVEEHGKTQPTNRIVIPERPFKNIGLEEKQTITFQKPKTTVNLLIDDNSVSTASYSDRDDFDFGSMSCDEDVSNKTTNEKNLKSNSSESSSSRATAKTFENKSLIMGRIFKNASTKAKAPVKSVGVQKDHAPKADLDQLFDELRGEAAPKAKSTETPTRKELVPVAPYESICQAAVKLPVAEIPISEPKRAPKSAAKKAKPSKKSQKDLTKLQSELGMSQEEVEKLIDEGQRKSKRRCATNRSKKLVEMWSSDEYEEFLSTKDIIALIEEKEKQEQRKKKKTNVASVNAVEDKDKRLQPSVSIDEGTKKSSRLSASEEKRNAERQKAMAQMAALAAASTSKPTTKEKEKDKDKSSRHSSVTNESNTRTTAKTKALAKQHDDSTNTSKASRSKRASKVTRQSSKRGHQQDMAETPEKTVTVADLAAAAAAGMAKKDASSEVLSPQIDDNLYLLDIKQNNNNTTRSNKTKKDKSAAIKEDVNTLLKPQERAAPAEPAELKKRNSGVSGSGSGNKKNKGKRKPQTDKSPARKRQAAEKLYYWSSSSDEDFGRINEHQHVPEFESSEQYQKHGWIVGDSHKKLVTLLAIAKGNKKAESCGVKKNVSKRKS